MRKWVLEKPQQVVGKMNRLQKMVGKPKQVMGKMNRLQKMVGKFQQVMARYTGCRRC